MPKKDKLVAGQKIPRPKRQAHSSLYARSALVARYGGDEFIVQLPHASAQQALTVAERIRTNVAAILVDGLFDNEEPFTITLSMGITEMQREPADDKLERVIQRADEALYKAKRSGRNRTVIFGQDKL